MTGAVTIGMPIYNSAASLTMALQSVCSQSSSRIERILISDNCSTDATPSLLEDWVRRDPRIDVVRHPRNLGPILNFDFVARQAKTPLFMFAADDDAWSPAFVDKLWDALAAQPTATLAYPRVELMSSDMKTTTKILPAREIAAGSRSLRARSALRIGGGGWFYGLYRTPALLPALDLVNDFGHPWGHDFVALLPFLLSGNVTAVDDAIFYKRITSRSTSSFRPHSSAERLALNISFRKVANEALSHSGLSLSERVYLAPFLNTYIGRHTFKLRDIAWLRTKELAGLAPTRD